MARHGPFPEITVHFYGSLSGHVRRGEGRIVALSADGCRIRTSEPLPQHSYLQLRISPDDTDLVVLIELAAIRSVEGQESTLEFLTIGEDQNGILQRLLQWIDEQE